MIVVGGDYSSGTGHNTPVIIAHTAAYVDGYKRPGGRRSGHVYCPEAGLSPFRDYPLANSSQFPAGFHIRVGPRP